ncbi:cytochrome c oxidase assembly factor 5 isoform X1 [Nerophis ophidion]|uniref:cytochrome c oxidase assembly factor 5 isoform X1 n=1 Tax=Nerophis ophidion TaxID=159077 RepID=UPI002ADF6A74|nr:cytochrome c oxidase assembly factor 5 isoform X1 [Nerophis ophidion]
MPKYYEDKEEDNTPCAGIKEDFKACLLEHDCVIKEGKMPSECLKEGHCKALQTTFFECKRSMYGAPKAVVGNIYLSKSHFDPWTQGQDSEEEKDIKDPKWRHVIKTG